MMEKKYYKLTIKLLKRFSEEDCKKAYFILLGLKKLKINNSES